MPSNTIVSVQTATAKFDELLDRVSHGDEIIITVDGKPAAKLAPIHANGKALPYGLLKGKLMMKADFDEPLPSRIAAKQKVAYSLPPTVAWPKAQLQRGLVKGMDDSVFFAQLGRAEFTATDKQSSP